MPHNEATSDDTVKTSLNRANPNGVNDMFRLIAIGDVIAAGKLVQRRVDMDAAGADVGTLATVDALVVPDGQKARQVSSAYARAGGVTGPLAVVAPGATPTTGQIAVAPNGNIVTLATDAITDLDVEYEGIPDVVLVEAVFPVVSDAVVLPNSISVPGAVELLEAELVEGTGTGNKIILIAGGTPAAGRAAINAAKTEVDFAAADAGVRARLKLLVSKEAADMLGAILESPAVTA